jgi:hypothetical protein
VEDGVGLNPAPHPNLRGASYSCGDHPESGGTIVPDCQKSRWCYGRARKGNPDCRGCPCHRCLELAACHLDQHSAERWMTIHGTHGPDDFRGCHGHLRCRHCARVILSWTRPPYGSVRCGDRSGGRWITGRLPWSRLNSIDPRSNRSGRRTMSIDKHCVAAVAGRHRRST